MAGQPILFIGQTLTSLRGIRYTIGQKVQDTVWFAKAQTAQNETVIIKSVANHPRVQNERDVLKLFQARTPYIRPLVDEIHNPPTPLAIVLKHLDSDLWDVTKQNHLNRKELKFVSRRVLEALYILHSDGYVHTDVKPQNVLVDFGSNDVENRFTNVQLADLGSSYPENHMYATKGIPVGATVWRSPEVILRQSWDTKMDIWCFGSLVISMIYGYGFCLFSPTQIPSGDSAYEEDVLKRQIQFFGPVPFEIMEIWDEETIKVICRLHDELVNKRLAFSCVKETEVCKKDKEFICWIMKLDPRTRPTARQILDHDWWKDEK